MYSELSSEFFEFSLLSILIAILPSRNSEKYKICIESVEFHIAIRKLTNFADKYSIGMQFSPKIPGPDPLNYATYWSNLPLKQEISSPLDSIPLPLATSASGPPLCLASQASPQENGRRDEKGSESEEILLFRYKQQQLKTFSKNFHCIFLNQMRLEAGF